MKCKVCGGTGTSNTCVNGTFKPCTFCDGTGEYEPFDLDVELDKLYPTEQTEQEYIQTCTTEQLAEFIVNLTLLDKYKLYDRMESAEHEQGIGIGAKKVIVEWLKEIHK